MKLLNCGVESSLSTMSITLEGLTAFITNFFLSSLYKTTSIFSFFNCLEITSILSWFLPITVPSSSNANGALSVFLIATFDLSPGILTTLTISTYPAATSGISCSNNLFKSFDSTEETKTCAFLDSGLTSSI
ncbi:Uncharacterised protein [Chlamydia trachomatis]|nr:Uncharacterised protein [Chlamydia trachomatis]